MIKFSMWSEADNEVRTIASKDHSETPVITLTTGDPMFDTKYITLDAHRQTVEDMGNAVQPLYRRNRWLFYGACLAIGLTATLSYHLGVRDGRRQAPTEYITVTEPQRHTVVKVQPFEVPDTYCPEEDSCEYNWTDADGDGFGEAQLVEVTP